MPTATASNATEHFSGDKCVAAPPLATEHTGRGVQGGVWPERLSIDQALCWLGRTDLAAKILPIPFKPSLYAAQLRAVEFLERSQVPRDEMLKMEQDGRLLGIEHLLGSGQKPSRLTPSLSKIRKSIARHLYVLELVGIGTKVGITQSPGRRLSAHAAAAKRWQRELGRTWVSVAHVEALRNEKVLVRLEPGRSEFLSLPFDAVVERALQLRMTTLKELFYDAP